MEAQFAIQLLGNVQLRPDVIDRISTVGHRIQLSVIMNVADQTIKNYLKDNDARLTQYAPLQYIMKVMGCLDASEVLEPKKQIA